MTHYIVRYEDMTPQAKHEKALADIADYMGLNRYVSFVQECVRARDSGYNPSRDAWHMMLSFAGIEGYPCDALYAEIWPYG